MQWTLTAIGLVLDIIGFVLVFIFGGFDMSSKGLAYAAEHWTSKPIKYFGAFLVITGFCLQLYGTLF